MTEQETVSVEILEATDKLLELVASTGQAVGKYNFLPLDTLLALDELSQEYPGLRYVLRKQRGDRYELRVLKSKNLEKWETKGMP